MKIRATFDAIKDLLNYGQELSTSEKNLLCTGAKALYLGGGWWSITGYAQDKRDVLSIKKMLT